MQTEAIYNAGNPWNPLAIEYHGTDTQAKKRWNSRGVSVFNTRNEGYKALADYFQMQGMTGFLDQFKSKDQTLNTLYSTLNQVHWSGPGYAGNVLSNAQGGAWMGTGASGVYGASGSVVSGSTSPPQTVIVNQYGNTSVANTKAASQYSAYEQTANALSAWGLDDPALIKMAHQRAQAGEDYHQIIADIRKTPQYEAAFPGMADRAKLGLPPLSESQYLTYQNYMMGLANKYALPHGFVTKAEVGKLVAHNVSPSEFQSRLDALSGVATKADPLVRQEFQKFYGVRGALGAMTAYFADPKRATDLLTQQATAAQLAAQAGESGLGALDKAHATHLAQLEYTQHLAPGTARQAIDTASNFGYLQAGAPGSVAPRVNESQLIGSQVAGYTHEGLAADRGAVKAAESARESFLQSGGGYAATPKGVTGVGAASSEGRGGA